LSRSSVAMRERLPIMSTAKNLDGVAGELIKQRDVP
jgi:hypothetical protein